MLIHRWHSNNPGGKLTKTTMISEVARPAFESALSRRETTIKAFEMSGIFPFNPEAPDKNKLKPGEIFKRPEETVVLGETVVGVALASDLPDEAILLASEENSGANIDVVDLSTDPASDQFEADTEEAVLRSLEDRSRETDPISQPGCSHWSISQPQPGPIPQLSAQGRSPPQTGPPQTVPDDLGFREYSLRDKKRKLEGFQLLMLEEEELSHFEDLFKQGKRFEIKNFLWLSWLPLKLAAVGTETEAFDFVLQQRTPANVPKRVTKRKVSQPEGVARINPQSDEYKKIFQDRIESEARREETKKATLKRKQERETLKNLKKEKIDKNLPALAPAPTSALATAPSLAPAPSQAPGPSQASAPAATPARQRGRPRKNPVKDSDASLADVFAKRKR